MQTLLLKRFCYGDQGTFGRLYLPSGVSLFTVERPWISNKPSISCIPEGIYQLWPQKFFRGGYDTMELLEVPGRSHILIHIANWPREVEGCIGVGTGLDFSNGMVLGSRDGFKRFIEEAEAVWAEFKALSADIQSVHAVLAA